MSAPPHPEPAAAPSALAEPLLMLIRELARELRPGTAVPALTLDSSLDADAGIDSLGRAELLLRIERTFRCDLDTEAAVSAETPRQLLAAVRNPAPAPAMAEPPRAPAAAKATARRIPADLGTLTDALAWHAAAHPDHVHIRLYDDGPGRKAISYGELLRRAEAVAAGLGARGLEPGRPVALMLATGAEFFDAFMGVLLAGGVPVPLYPPARLAQIEEHLRRQTTILDNAQAGFLITVPEAGRAGRLLQSSVPSLRATITPAELAGDGGRLHQRRAAGDLALIQYTSGSTGDPKGVSLTHANLIANVRAMGEAIQVRQDDVFVSWLPLYHDMGLIGAWLGSLYHGHPLVVMPPLAFIGRPQRWLRAIHEYRGTLSAAPNFAYDLCARSVRDVDLEGLDLSSWRVAFNGAEPVHPDTLERFIARLASAGFRRRAMTPVYGLAECSVGLAFPDLDRGPRLDVVARDSLRVGAHVRAAAADDPAGARLVACGHALPGHELRIADEANRPLPERVIGRIQFRGPSATRGYYRNADATRALFRDGWLDSGDYGYLSEGELYITGRAKELIIRAGRNLYPYELEQAVAALEGVRRHGVAVFGSPDPRSGQERLVVLAETRERNPQRLTALRERIQQLTLDVLELPPDDIVLAPPRAVPKTSSGKIRRAACRQLYEHGALGRQRAVWLQLTRLGLNAVLPAARRGLRSAGALLYAAYAWLAFAVTAAIAGLAVLLPNRRWRNAGSSAAARLLLRLTGIRWRLTVLHPLPADGTCILVANHASYADGILLWGLLRARYGFVAKRELRRYPLLRGFLERIGTRFVERFDHRGGVRDIDELHQAMDAGGSLLFFPEGTFTRAAGLRPFRMGAFVVAAKARTPVVPIAIRGTRAVLRGDEWFPRPGAVEVTVCAPIAPDGEDWNAALRLRDAVRAEILRYCGEPDLQ